MNRSAFHPSVTRNMLLRCCWFLLTTPFLANFRVPDDVSECARRERHFFVMWPLTLGQVRFAS
jgi:hypothetical protein